MDYVLSNADARDARRYRKLRKGLGLEIKAGKVVVYHAPRPEPEYPVALDEALDNLSCPDSVYWVIGKDDSGEETAFGLFSDKPSAQAMVDRLSSGDPSFVYRVWEHDFPKYSRLV